MKNFSNTVKNYIINTLIPIFTQIQWLEIPVSTYVRWILTVVVSLNTALLAFDINPITVSETTWYTVVSIILNIAVLIVNTYKNNSTSKEALITDKILRALKAASQSDEDSAIGKLNDILKELNGEEYISPDQPEDHTNEVDQPENKE